MIQVGITGGIGSGKTTVSRLFETFGIPVFYADTVAQECLARPEVIQKIKSFFGEQLVNHQNHLNKVLLAAIVFKDKEKLQLLNSIIHPLVAIEYQKWLLLQKSPYTLKEAAILLESGAYKNLNKIISVVSPLELRINRVMQRNKFTREQVLERINNQLSDEERMAKSDFIIANDEVQALIPQVQKIDIELRNS